MLEVGRLRRERRLGGKTDALDAVRAARSVLAQTQPTQPRAGGEREALRALMAAREGAVNARRAGLCQLRDLLITAPEPLRSELRPLTRAQLLRRLAAARPERRRNLELRGTLRALQAVAVRVQQLTAEERELAGEIETLTRKLAPQLLDQPGCRAARGRPDPDLLVAPRPDQKRSRLRATRRLRSDPSLLGTNDPLPARPQRRPPTQPGTAHDRRHQTPRALADDRLHQPSHPRRQEPPRSKPLPQALPRPQPLPTTRTRSAAGDLTNIEASLAQRSVLAPQPMCTCRPMGHLTHADVRI